MEIGKFLKIIMKKQKIWRLLASKDTESVIVKPPTNKSLGPDSFTSEFYQTFKEELILILHKLFQKVEDEAILPHLFYKANITLIPKPGNDTTQKRKITGQWTNMQKYSSTQKHSHF